MNDDDVQIVKCDLAKQDHRSAVINLLGAYMNDKMGGGKPMPDEVSSRLIEGLSEHPAHFILFAKTGSEYVGLATCFIGFSTFHARKLVNVHDIVVLPGFRGRGIGRLLMRGVEREARRLDCCKITLEVREDNFNAQALYRSEGFDDCQPPMLFWHKPV